ncbi:MAG: TniB family NTP-binding protein [Flavobacterium sp.]|nr:TniB family NTP-binding protein [Flavobacterium sp.]
MMKHLSENTRIFVEAATDEQRINHVKEFRWIGYSDAIKILKKMEDLLDYPKSSRMPNLLLVGDSNNGKTVLLNQFHKRHQAYVDEDEKGFSKVINPVLYIQAPPEPDEKRFYNIIFEKLYAPYKTSEKIEQRQLRLIHLLKEMETKVLVIDEIHHVLAGTLAKQRLFLNVLKYLSNELQIPLICAGTRDAFNAIQTDTQLSNRFEPKVLPRWTNDKELKRLLISFENILPLKKESHLIENSITNKILAMSDGLIGEISKIIELSTIMAIETKIEKITPNILNSIDYISPDKRKKYHI